MAIDLRRFCAALLTLVSLPALGDKIPLESFFKDYKFDDFTISPNGRHFVFTYPANDTTNIAVLDIEQKKIVPLTGYKYPARVIWVEWESDERIVYGALQTSPNFAGEAYNIGAINRDGRNHLFILDNTSYMTRPAIEEVVDWLPDTPDRILISSNAESWEHPAVYSVNTRGGAQTQAETSRRGFVFPTSRYMVVKPPGRWCDYVTDHKGVVRTCLTQETDLSRRLLYRANDDAAWQELAKFPDQNTYIRPVGFTDDDAALIVLSNVGRDTRALYVYEPDKRALAELVFEAPEGIDVGGATFSDYSRRFTAASYTTDGPHMEFFDQDTANAHAALRQAFPGKTVSMHSFSADGKRGIAFVHASDDPGTFYLYDSGNKRLSELAARAPWLVGVALNPVRAISYQTRDGTTISGYLTLPAGREARKLPLVVNPHGGPIGLRDFAGFDPDAQFLASRGYAVLKVNFRGSGGYGKAFRKAGFREWGKKMQDDITDGVEWTVKEGIADRSRICIYGASYGGYAAMMGLVRTPELYKCAISLAGVSDLKAIMALTQVTVDGVAYRIPKDTRKFWEEVIGERTDEAGLRAQSPLYNAAQIRAPLFLAHGDDDIIVPNEQSTAMRDQMKKLGKTIEYASWHDEGHGFHEERNRIDFFTRLEKFLAQHLPADANVAAAGQ